MLSLTCTTYSPSSFSTVTSGIIGSKAVLELLKKYATRNIVKDVCDFYSNVDNVPINIAKHFGLYKSTIHKYLNQGNKFGWCIPDYTGSKKPISVFKDDKYIDTYESASFLGKNGKDIFGTTLDSSCITAVCKGKRKSHKGYVFKYAR